MHESDTTPVTVIGLGRMGAALAAAFLARGHATTVWNRSAGKADALVCDGAIVAPTPAAAIAASPVVVVCVADYDAVRDLLEPEAGLLAGRVLVNLTSGTPDQAREAAAWTDRRGIDYLDGAIMAVPPGIGRPETLIFYGGSQAVFEAYEPTLRALGGAATHLGADPGVALLHDLALLGMLWTSTAGYLHALALVGTAGVTPAQFLPFAAAWFEHVLAPDLAATAAEVAGGDYATDVSSLAVNARAMDHLIHAGRAAGVGAGVLEPIQALLDRHVADGHGDESLAGLIERFKPPAAVVG